MPATRSSARNAASSGSEPSQAEKSPPASAGSKRKASEPKGKRGRPKKNQTTIEETMPLGDQEQSEDVEMKESEKEEHEDEKRGEQANGEHKDDEDANDHTESDATKQNGAVKNSPEREETMPSNIIEKGLIYFFVRGRVEIEHPHSVSDLQRSYIVLRPLPDGAKLTDGPIQDLKNNRLIALPKKVLPKSHHDRFMAFVEKANTTVQDLKDNFMKGAEYETKTQGVRHTPAVTPIGEGVYAITSTGQASGRTSHIAYELTIPSELGDVQHDIGLSSKGSFITSLKNPSRSGNTAANLPKPAEFPKDIMDEFRGLAWVGLSRADQLNYENAQILLIGEAADNIEKASETAGGDENKETPAEEIEKLEHEDELRVEHLKGDDTVFEDLKVSKADLPSLQTTW